MLFILLIVFILINILEKYNDNKKVFESFNTYQLNDSYNELLCKNILVINKIDLKKCMNVNDVDKDLAVLYDDKTVVIAGHSGNNYNAYFRNLYKLDISDEVIFYHNGEKSIYKVIEINHKKKKDKLVFNNIENQLILITCSRIKQDEQLVYFLKKST